MDKSILVNKINMHCPICDNIHDVEERKEIIEIVLYGKKVTYEERFYHCTETNKDENEFLTGAMMNEAINAWKTKRKENK